MKAVGFTEVHTGADYLYYAIRGAAPAVETYYVAYGGQPGHRPSPYVCPDTEEQLRALAEKACQEVGVPLVWYGRERWGNRYAQRNSIFQVAPDADVVLLTDADEVWADDAAAAMVRAAWQGDVRFYRCRMVHFWRSFGWAVREAPGYPKPLRAYNTHFQGELGQPWQYAPEALCYHFGWAREPHYWLYKMPVSGHYYRPEHMRWFREVWLPWSPENGRHDHLHPYGDGRFEAIEPFDKTQLPDFMCDHPYYNLPLIGGHAMPDMELTR